MPEGQTEEYKASWHEDHIKIICGFANAAGGSLYLGVDDKGKVIGLNDYQKLLANLPNKVRQVLDITVSVQEHIEEGRPYLEVVTPARQEAVSCRSRYYIRSGSTTQELTGADLNTFLLEKGGKAWDQVLEPDATLEDLNMDTLKQYATTAEGNGRLQNVINLPPSLLLQKLKLADKEGKLTRAALVLFGKEPQQKYLSMKVRIARFADNDMDIYFQNEVEGNLFEMLYGTLEQLEQKYFIKPITFEGIYRKEGTEYPIIALREALLNALVHRVYSKGSIEIKVYDSKLSIWNYGLLPDSLTVEELKGEHRSSLRNPLIAEACYKAGLIESWGTGTLKIISECEKAGMPEPVMQQYQEGFQVTLFQKSYLKQELAKHGCNDRQQKAILHAQQYGSINNTTYQQINSIGRSVAAEELGELVDKGLLVKSGTGRGTIYTIKYN